MVRDSRPSTDCVITMPDLLALSSDALTVINIATIASALVIMVVVAFFAITTVRSVKAEFNKVKEALSQVAAGTYNEKMPHASFKESAEVLSYIERLAHNLQRQREAVAILAFSDHLTNLANRVRFEDELTRGFNFAKRGLSICVVMINITGFSQINARSGRALGDQLLRVMANTLRQNIRKTDLAARFDSDEFGLVLPSMETNKVVDWLVQLEQHFVTAQRGDELLKTLEPRNLRFGYSFVSEIADKDAQEVFERANKALAQATPDIKSHIIGV